MCAAQTFRVVLAWGSVIALALQLSSASAFDGEREKAVLALFAKKCAECHSEKAEKSSGFSVDERAKIFAGGDRFGPPIVAGDPQASPLIQLLRGEKKPRMPLEESLSEEEIAQVEAWIRDLKPEETAAVKRDEWRWPFEKPVKPEIPSVKRSDWVINPIDAFLLQKLEAANLAPAPPASKRTLARRLYLDLVGMPPTPEELDAFLKDGSPSAYEELIETLLADPRYGERWGRYWLDLVRYGETNGLEGDGAIGNAWRYRDWVIDAFNRDMPYDQFVIQQLAGVDEHSKTAGNYQPDIRGHIPTGFLRLAPWDRSNLVADEVRQNYLNEITSATGSIFLGITIGCSQCHDHKYDPIPQRDFYRFQAFFSPVQVDDVAVPHQDPVIAERANKKIAEYEAKLRNGPEKRGLEELLAQLRNKLVEVRKAGAKANPAISGADLRLEFRRGAASLISSEKRTRFAELERIAGQTGEAADQQAFAAYEAELVKELAEAYKQPGVDPLARFDVLNVDDVRNLLQDPYSPGAFFSEEEQTKFHEFTAKLEAFRRRIGRWRPSTLTVRNAPGPPNGPGIAPTFVLVRGDYRQPAEVVKAGFPSAIMGHSDPAEIEADRYRQFPTRGWRMTLAKWIASPDNPLTARVMVNRIWQGHFGRGIVATPSNFGKVGDRPTHPELLDWLAHAFIERGWSIKAMHRLLLTSAAYRQSSENPASAQNQVDPENKLLWRYNRHRLEAEAIRDGILSVSGRINLERGGPSIFPPLPDDLADFARYGRGGGLMWEPNDTEADARRRSVYIFQRRSLPLPMMAAFDATGFSESCPLRNQTTTPLQALSLMNGSLVQEESQALARQIESEAGADRGAQISLAFIRILGREPEPEELTAFSEFKGPLEGVCRVLFNSNEFLYVE